MIVRTTSRVTGKEREFAAFCETIGLHLEPFQRRIVRAFFGPEPELLVLIPRGNGKTTLLAALCLWELRSTPNPAVYVAAASRDQARVLFEAARDMALRLDDPDIVIRHLELRVPGGHLRVLASDAPKLHGLSPTLAICEESHAHADGEVYISLKTAMLKRPGARMVSISTAGQGADTPLDRLRARALALPNVTRRGALIDAQGPGLRMLEWSVPDDADITNPREVKKANPASWLTPAALAAQRDAVPDLAYRRYHCNQWCAQDGHWLPAGAWQACVGDPTFTDGEPVWVGVDVGGERSATAVVWVSETLQVGAEIFHGDSGVLDAVDVIRELAGRYDLREVVYDPWRFGQGAQELERERVPVLAFPQTDVRMIPASQRLHAAITEQRLTLPDDPEMARHAADSVARHSRRGWRIDKPKPTVHNDSIIALCMALERAEHQAQPVQLLGWL